MLNSITDSAERNSGIRKAEQYIPQCVLSIRNNAIVIKANATSTGETVVLKVFNVQRNYSNPQLTNVQREVSILKRISHPNIVAINEILEFTDRVVISMEYCRRTLFDWTGNHPPPSEIVVLETFCEIARAIEYLHSHYIAHGDVKLENILLDDSGHPKLADFGFAHLEKKSSAEKRGTLVYAAPELLQNGPIDTHAADVWACGIVLFAMLTQQFPYPPGTDASLMAFIRRGCLTYSLVQSRDLRMLIMKMTTVNPTRRATIRDVLAEVQLLKMHRAKN
jgi:serine/threonine protein kinase